MTRPHPEPTTHERSVRRRDAAMLRLRRAKQALAAASLLLAGVVATAAARTFPGKTTHRTVTVLHTPTAAGAVPRPPVTSKPATTTVAPTPPATATVAPAPQRRSTALAAPVTAPTPAAPATAVVTSGGS